MKRTIFTITLSLLIAFTAFAQETVLKPVYLRNSMDSIAQEQFNQSLETLFSEIIQGKINEDLLTPKRAELTKSILQEFVTFESRKDSAAAATQDKQLINIYPISDNEYFLSVAYVNGELTPNPIIFYTIDLIATKTGDNFTFSVPVDYLTRYWKTQTVGNISYHYRGELNTERAKIFDEKNTIIAEKLGVEPEKLDFYMCDHYQEIMELLGFNYSLTSNGQYRDGYGVDAKTIFSVMDNEDFSHDMFHYYSGKINERINRNWITEEGIAYAWGNAYYTDEEGEMITHSQLVKELKNYLTQNPDTDLFELFSKDIKIFKHLAPEVSTRSTISGIIAMEVEKQKGKEGISALINAGSQDRLKNYLTATDDLIGINEKNFDVKVKELILEN
ncbi:hypothetical protein ABWH96_17920 [Marivirga tractuosa]|uniref:hypothetical protein n=1 Tax=Marivirga tractuosa TaxID=1006 RepID=UPI0035D0E0AC